jgi:RimJ/RimL family protein N-acetyltransferase
MTSAGQTDLPLRSDRLFYEPLAPRHAAELFPALSDPKVYACIGEDPPADVAALEKHYAAIERGPQGEFAHQTWRDLCVKRCDTNEAIGTVGTTTIDHKAEVGYLFGPGSWGRGYASEAMRWYQAWLLQELDVTEFWACIRPDNARSLRLIERLGYLLVTNAQGWPDLRSHDPGDHVFRRPAVPEHDADRHG